jgi:hypothetical protein
LFVIVDRVHDPLTYEELDYLGVMATNLMKYLELQTTSREQRSHKTMSEGLPALVEGRARIPSDWDGSDAERTGTSNTHAETIDCTIPDYVENNLVPEAELDARNVEPEEDATLYRSVFARASNLLRESLDVDYTVFVDTGSDLGMNLGAHKPKKANLIGYSSTDQSTAANRDLESSCDIEQTFLSTLCQRYHDGKIGVITRMGASIRTMKHLCLCRARTNAMSGAKLEEVPRRRSPFHSGERQNTSASRRAIKPSYRLVAFWQDSQILRGEIGNISAFKGLHMILHEVVVEGQRSRRISTSRHHLP